MASATYLALIVTNATFDGFAPGSECSEVSPGNFTFEGLYTLHGASDNKQLTFKMDTSVNNGATMDFSNTGTVSFVLPTSVSCT